ncbi:hypothetical protein I5677_07330 [Mobilitalea sibirica]|uniref:Uncharacterized protein n=1 Tax=Mobilitalea sibirica TaxID=1462919 RepID=A0A8J7H2G5_9FIRM|nr:STM3941 family protein [Mobilitalea sibirica]MBH1940695.1 hypothetical protein [Mobilitalea sibirica]
MGDIVIEESNYRAFALSLASLFLLLAAIAIMVYGIIRYQQVYYVIGIFVSLAFFIVFVVNVLKATKVKVLLTITVEGIIDNSSISGLGFISFDDIKEFQIIDQYKTRVIAVIPKNMNNFLEKQSITKRRQIKRNIYMNLPPVSINAYMAKDMEPEDILSLLQKRLVDYNRLYD